MTSIYACACTGRFSLTVVRNACSPCSGAADVQSAFRSSDAVLRGMARTRTPAIGRGGQVVRGAAPFSGARRGSSGRYANSGRVNSANGASRDIPDWKLAAVECALQRSINRLGGSMHQAVCRVRSENSLAPPGVANRHRIGGSTAMGRRDRYHRRTRQPPVGSIKGTLPVQCPSCAVRSGPYPASAILPSCASSSGACVIWHAARNGMLRPSRPSSTTARSSVDHHVTGRRLC